MTALTGDDVRPTELFLLEFRGEREVYILNCVVISLGFHGKKNLVISTKNLVFPPSQPVYLQE